MTASTSAPTSTATIKDPICGMAVDPAKAIHVQREGQTYYFCGNGCRDKFLAKPAGTKAAGTKTEKAGGNCCG